MKYCKLLFLLFSLYSVCFCIASRYIDFTGSTYGGCDKNSAGSLILTLYFSAEITGFTSDYHFIMYTPKIYGQPYSYMTCTVPSTTDPNYYVICQYDLEKFHLIDNTVVIPDEFPTIDDCQVSYWNKVTKSEYYTFFRSCSSGVFYNKYYSPSTITDTLCYSSTQNIIQTTGTLYDSQSSQFVEKTSLSVPAFIDGIETTVDCTLNYTKKSTWQYNCLVNRGKKLTFFYTIVKASGLKFLIEIRRDFNLINCQNPNRMIRFLSVSASCSATAQKKNVIVNFNSHIFGFNQKENFIIKLESPSYAYLECTIPKSPTSSGEKVISCILDSNKFPLYSYRKITLPSSFPDINCEINYWGNINKLHNVGVCFPTLAGEITPGSIDGPECIKDDYNMFIIPSTISISTVQTAHLFDLNVLVDGKNDVIPCELYTGGLTDNTYYPMYCYSNSGPNSNISLFETTITIESTKTIFIGFNENTKINLNNCLVSEKIIYFTSIEFKCSQDKPNLYYADVLLYAKINGFPSDYSFKLYLESPSPSYYYMDCIIPASQTGLQQLTYIECKLDLLKFPLKNPTTLALPLEFTLEGTTIKNWGSIIKQYNAASCNPQYSVEFSAKQYIETSCYKPHYNKITVIGEISSKKDYSFKMSAVVDGQSMLLPCEIKNVDGNYQLECITNGKNTVSIYNTFVVDDNTKEIIYIKASNLYTLKECNPTKIISFTQMETKCEPSNSLFKILFSANIEGFSEEESITIYLEQPSYVFMNCAIPQSTTSANKVISCLIDVNRFALISADNIIILPSIFYIHPELEIIGWEKMLTPISTSGCSSIYQYAFNPVKYFDTECYLNGYNAFIVEGTFEENNNNLNFQTITFDTLIDSQYHTLSCEIYLSDVSNKYSRLYCYSTETNNVKIFPTIAQGENLDGKILINADHIYKIKNCPTDNKKLFFKGIDSDCSINESILKILIYSESEGFENEEEITINLEYPNLSYMNCIIPKSSLKDNILCKLDISKFPLIVNNTIKLTGSFPLTSNCDVSTWKNINKVLRTGKCHPNYSLIFNSSKLYESKCYAKNKNVIALLGSLDIKENGKSESSQIYSFTLNSIVNGNYDNLL